MVRARNRRPQGEHRATDLLPTIRQLRETGTTSLWGITDTLNSMGVPSPRGGRWYASSVRSALALAGEGA